MSYRATAALQEAIFGALTLDANVDTLSAGAIFDALPPGPVPPLYVSLGAERAVDASDTLGRAAIHDFPVTVITDQAGYSQAKALAAAISDALDGADLALSRGHLTSLNFRRARARRVGEKREIEVWFRAFVDASDA